MSAMQKHAWFNLAVVLLSTIVVIALIPVLGVQRAQGGFGILGFLGFGPLFFLRRAGAVVSDERDGSILVRSWVIAYAVFWLVFVAACVAAPFSFGSSGAVPVVLIQVSVWCALILVVGVGSVATLVQYGWGGSNASE
jgi:hypothetical protein